MMSNNGRRALQWIVIPLLVVLVASGGGWMAGRASRPTVTYSPTTTASIGTPVRPSASSGPTQSPTETGDPDGLANFPNTAWLVYTPLDASVTIDGNIFNPTNDMTAYIGYNVPLAPGDHTVSVARDGFITQTIAFSLEDGDTRPILVVLQPSDGNVDAYYTAHPDDDDVRTSIEMQWTSLMASSGMLPYQGDGFEIELQGAYPDPYELLVTCHLSVISHDECKQAARIAVRHDLMVDVDGYVLVWQDV